jgi:hypothetical protein
MNADTLPFAVFVVGFALGLIHTLVFCVIFVTRLVNGETSPIDLKEVRQIQPPWLRRLQRLGLAFMAMGVALLIVPAITTWTK